MALAVLGSLATATIGSAFASRSSSGAPDATRSPVQRAFPRGLAHDIGTTNRGKIRVILIVRSRDEPPFDAASRRLVAPAPGPPERFALRHAPKRYALRYAKQQSLRRRQALHDLDSRSGRTLDRDEQLERAIAVTGGRIIEGSRRYLAAVVPTDLLPILARRPDVQAVLPGQEVGPLDDVASAASASGAATWWMVGHTGGRGGADVPANLAIIQDSIYQPHPAFAGISFENRPGYIQDGPNVGINGHGTAVLSMAASQGPTGCTACAPDDVHQKGTAYGVRRVLNPDGALSELDWSAGQSFGYYDNGTSSWKIQPGAADPAQVMSYSRGALSSVDDTGEARTWDEAIDVYGTTAVVAAGNSGPQDGTINNPALAYNVIAAGAYCCSSSGDHSTDVVSDWSSRGPTVGGRKKPDLVAPGDGQLADVLYNTTGSLWKYQTGTSFAAPQIAAGATLLAGAGIRDPKVVKALLINSARLGRSAPGELWGSQVGWQPDFGWGELDLDAAYQQRLNFDADEVPQNSARFYRATAQGAGERATLVWHRRVNPCSVLRTGCVYSDPGYHVYSLTNLDLAAYSTADGALQSTSNSTIDNVEQVRTTGAGDVIYKVTAGYVDGHPAEPYALAAKQPVTRLVTPQPTVMLATDAAAPVAATQNVTITATVANPSPDLVAPSTQATLTLPSGVELVSGEPTQSLGALAKHGAAGSSATATWTVRGTSDGIKSLKATATSTLYDTQLSSSATRALTIDAVGPRVAISSPAGVTPNPTLPVAWGGSDAGSSVGTYDVEVSVNGGPFVAWLTATTQTAATYTGTLGNRYRFRIRAVDALGNASGYVESDDISIVSVLTEDPTSTNPGGGTKRVRAELKVARTVGRRTAFVIGGTINSAASGQVSATWTAKVRRKRIIVRARGRIRSGRFTIKLAIPRRARAAKRATVTLSYRGNTRVRPAVRRVSVRR